MLVAFPVSSTSHRQTKRDTEWTEHRADFAEHVEELQRGDYGYVVNPAKAYLKLF